VIFDFMFTRQLRAALICAIGALILTKSVAAPATGAQARAAREARQARQVAEQIGVYKRVTWHWEHVIGLRRTPSTNSADRSPDLAYRRWVLGLWKRRAAQLLARASAPPHRAGWSCIHRFEGSWHSNTGNGYYGGLQMDLGFQRRYGAYLLRRKGTADRWSPLEQMWVAEHAHRSGRGFYPWPHTARYCRLL
jgi:hypothetical protein